MTDTPPQAEASLVPPQMDMLILGFYCKGPKHTTDESPELEARHQAHLRHLGSLYETGKMIIAGPTPDSPDGIWRGGCLFFNTTLEEVRALMQQDPQVQYGHFNVQVMTWYVPHGKLDLKFEESIST